MSGPHVRRQQKSYDRFIHDCAKLLFPYIDKEDWGYFNTEEKHPISNLSNDGFKIRQLFGRGTVPDYSKTRLEEHMYTNKVHYMRSNYWCGRALICLDLDCKNGEDDVLETATYIIKKYHQGCYHEESTGGKGRHLYLKIDREGMELREFKKLLDDYRRSLRIVLAHKGFKAPLDKTCGNTSITSLVFEAKRWIREWGPGDRGILAKIPKFKNRYDDLRVMVAAPIQKLSSLHRVIRDAQKITAQKTAKKKSPTKAFAKALPFVYDILTKPTEKSPLSLSEIRVIPDAFVRTHQALSCFVNSFRRYPYDPCEFRNFYESNNLHTAHNEQIFERERRCCEVLEFRKKNAHGTKTKNGGFSADYYRSIIRKYVNESHFNGVKLDKYHKVKEEHLAVGLYIIESNAFATAAREEWQFTTGNDCIQQMFKNLKSYGLIEESCNINQSVAIKKVLVNAGLVSVEDTSWLHAGKEKGRCKKYGLAENHPQYAEFVAFKKKFIKEPVTWVMTPASPVPEHFDSAVNFDDYLNGNEGDAEQEKGEFVCNTESVGTIIKGEKTMAKAWKCKVTGNWVIKCPGCDSEHSFDGRWTFNDDVNLPTFHPSMNSRCNTPDMKEYKPEYPSYICHSFVEKGKIRFLSDCSHALEQPLRQA